MPNPPYSGGVVILEENADGFNLRVFHWSEVLTEDGSGLSEIPPSPTGLKQALSQTVPRPSFVKQRNCATKAAAITAFTQYINAQTTFPDSA